MKSFLIRLISTEAATLLLAGHLQAALIGLRCKDTGKWLCAEGGGGSTLVANRTGMGPWETFSVTDINGGSLQSGDLIGFQAPTGNYLCAEGGGGGSAVVNRWALGGWEKFWIIRKDGPGTIRTGDEVFVRGESGHYMCAENGGGGAVNVNRTTPGGWETFYATVHEIDPPTESMYRDVNGDGIPDEIIKQDSPRFRVELDGWWMDCTNYWAIDFNGYWRAWDIYYASYYDSWFTTVWDIDDWLKAALISSECYTYFSKVLRFQADEGHDYVLYEDASGSHDLNPATWIPVYSVSQWGNELRTVGLGTYDASELDDRAYYLVRFGRPWTGFDIQLSNMGAPDIIGSGTQMEIHNPTASLISMRIRDSSGRTIYNDPRIRWVVTDATTGAVLLDQTGVEPADLTALGDGRAVRVVASIPGTSLTCEFWLTIVIYELRPGVGGNPNKTRNPDNTFIFAQERSGSCTIAALRNAIHVKGAVPPSEDDIIALLGTLGKDPRDFEDLGKGMTIGPETEVRYDAVLHPLGLDAIHLGEMTEAQFEQELLSGATLIVGTNIVVRDQTNPANTRTDAKHAVCMRMVNGMVEVYNSNNPRAPEMRTIQEALRYPPYGGTPPQTGEVIRIQTL